MRYTNKLRQYESMRQYFGKDLVNLGTQLVLTLISHLSACLLLGGGVRRNSCRGDSVGGEWSRWLCLLLWTLQAR